METNELDELNSSHVSEPVTESTPEPVAEAPVEDSVVEEAPAPEETQPEAAPATEEPAPEPSELDILRAQFEKQQEIINRLVQGQPLIDVPPGTQAPKAEEPAQPSAPAPKETLVTEELFNAILSDPGAFNDFIVGLVEKTRQDAVQEAYGLSMQNLPGTILPAVHEAAQTQIELRSWAQNNPIVLQNREIAAKVLDQIDGYYPALSVPEKLQKTLDYLNIHYGAPAPRGVAAPVQAPAFAQPPRGGRPKPAPVSAIQAELDEL